MHCHRLPESGQGDLFLDGGKTASIRALRHAVIARDASRVGREMQRTSSPIPGYRYISNCERLIAVLEAPIGETAAQAFEALECSRRQAGWLRRMRLKVS